MIARQDSRKEAIDIMRRTIRRSHDAKRNRVRLGVLLDMDLTPTEANAAFHVRQLQRLHGWGYVN